MVFDGSEAKPWQDHIWHAMETKGSGQRTWRRLGLSWQMGATHHGHLTMHCLQPPGMGDLPLDAEPPETTDAVLQVWNTPLYDIWA